MGGDEASKASCTYCNDSQKCTNEQVILNTLLTFFSIGDGTATTLIVVVDGLRNDEDDLGPRLIVTTPSTSHLFTFLGRCLLVMLDVWSDRVL